MPELAVIRLAVYDNTDKQLGMRILPFNDMQVKLNFQKAISIHGKNLRFLYVTLVCIKCISVSRIARLINFTCGHSQISFLQNGYRHVALKTEGNYPMSLPMIFVQFEIKIYVPDGLGDFMDALVDPR